MEAIALLAYWSISAVPEAVQVVDAPTARLAMKLVPSPQSMVLSTNTLSLTLMLVNGTSPSLVTTYSHVTAEPIRISGPGASSASTPLVDFSMSIDGLIIATVALSEPLTGLPSSSAPDAVTVSVSSPSTRTVKEQL